MKTTTFIITTAIVAGTLFSCGKKDDVGGSTGLKTDKSAVTVQEDGEAKITVTARNVTVSSNNENIATGSPIDKTINVLIKGKKEGTAILTLSEGNSKATVTVNVTKKENSSAVLKVNTSSIIFLEKNKEVNITNRVIASSGRISIESPASSVATVRQSNNQLYVTGVGEGLSGIVRIKDLTTNEEAEIPVYVIVPFTAVSAPTEITVGDKETINLKGVYNTGSVLNGRYDRVTITTNNSNAAVSLETEDIKNNVGQTTGKLVTGFTITAKAEGTVVVTLTNGDGQTLKLNFTLTKAQDLFNIDANGVVTGVKGTLPTKVKLPDNAKKVAAGAFKNQVKVEEIDFNNVTEIEGKLFTERNENQAGIINVTSINIPNVKVIGDSAFRNAQKLRKVIFPASLTHLGGYAFGNCKTLTDVAFRGGVPKGLGNLSSTLIGGKYPEPKEDDSVLRNTFSGGPSVRVLYIVNPDSNKSAFLNKLGESNFRNGSATSVKDISQFK